MPAKRKISPAQRLRNTQEENKGLRIIAKRECAKDTTLKSDNGTLSNGSYMIKISI